VRDRDVLVVGAGPAGSACATLLARAGLDVALLDRAAFPRGKPCAEYLSPECARVLQRLGVLEALEQEGPAHLHGMRVVSPNGTTFTGRFGASRGVHPPADYGLALPRERLDLHLVHAATAAGADLHESHALEAIERASGGCVTVVARAGKTRARFRGRMLVGADGLNSRVAASLGVVRHGRRQRIALVTHYAGIAGMSDVGEMHVGTDGYLGLAPVGHGITNVSAIADPRGRVHGESIDRWFARLVTRTPEVAARLAAASRVSPVRAVGPFDRRTTRATADHTVLVGDAADFFDPFTGEGIYAALRGAELAARCLEHAFAVGRFHAAELRAYDRERRKTFGGKWIVERLIDRVLRVPSLFNHVAARLARRPHLADVLVGVTGDFVPAARVLSPTFLSRLLW